MKHIMLITLKCTVIVVCFLGIYYFGFINGEKIQHQKNLRFNLVFYVTNYTELRDGKAIWVQDNLALLIAGDVKAYDYYKQKDPHFGSEDPMMISYIAKARTIVSETSHRFISIPQKSQ